MEQALATRIRGREPFVAGLLTGLSLVVIFGAVLGYVPSRLLPRNEELIGLIPHLNAVVSLAAIATISDGYLAIRRGRIARHRLSMLASTALFGGFLVMYLYRISLAGPTEFVGPAVIRQFVYLPLLSVHILLAIVCLPFVYTALLLARVHPPAALGATAHPRVGRIAALLWVISFGMGIAVYLLLHVIY